MQKKISVQVGMQFVYLDLEKEDFRYIKSKTLRAACDRNIQHTGNRSVLSYCWNKFRQLFI